MENRKIGRHIFARNKNEKQQQQQQQMEEKNLEFVVVFGRHKKALKPLFFSTLIFYFTKFNHSILFFFLSCYYHPFLS